MANSESCSRSAKTAVPVKVLAFDFDKTCTKHPVLDIYKAREDYRSKAKTLDEEWIRLEEFYSVHSKRILSPVLMGNKPMPLRFDENGLREFLKEVQSLDTLAAEEVIKSNILKGITAVRLRAFAERVEIMPGLLNVLSSLKKLNLPFHIISLNFSKKLIEDVLNRAGSLPIDAHSNELELKQGICTGNMDKKFLSAFDKEMQLEKIVQDAGWKCGVTIYIGDSFNDLLALLKADIGLIIGNSKSMLKVCKDFGIHVLPLHEWSEARLTEKETAKFQRVLFSVKSWEEIKDFLFTFEQNQKEKNGFVPL